MSSQHEQLLQIVSQFLKQKYPEIWNGMAVEFMNDEGMSEKHLKDVIIDGRWDELIDELSTKYEGEEIVKVNLFKLIEQKIHETLGKGNQTEALEILRKSLSPLELFPERIHKLAQDILLMRAASKSRYSLAQEICSDLKKVNGLILSENRLEELVEQACEYQKMKCPFHVNDRSESANIWVDHKCKRNGPLKLKAEDAERKEIVVESSGELLNLYLSKNGEKLVAINDNSDTFLYEFDAPGRKAKRLGSCNSMESLNFWPKITDNLIEINGKNLSISNLVTPSPSFPVDNPISIAITADTEFCICSTEGQITTLYDLKDGKVLHSWVRLRCSHLLTPRNPIDKYFLAVSDNGSILQISTESFKVLKTLPSINERVQVSSAFLDGERLLVGYNNSTLYYYEDWQEYEHPTRIFRGHSCTKFRVNCILSRFNPNLALSCSENGSIYAWNIATGRLTHEIAVHEKCSNDILELGMGKFVTCGDDGKLYEWTF